MRNSLQRDVILDIIVNQKEHYTSKEIYELAQTKIPNISLGTIYRNLNQLVAEGYITRLKTKDGLDRYDNNIHKHHHFICDKCLKIMDIDDEIPLAKNNFPDGDVAYYTIQFHGLCKQCKEGSKNNGTKRK